MATSSKEENVVTRGEIVKTIRRVMKNTDISSMTLGGLRTEVRILVISEKLTTT